MKSVLLGLVLAGLISTGYSQKPDFQLLFQRESQYEQSDALELVTPATLPESSTDTLRILLRNNASFKTSFAEGYFTHFDFDEELITRYGPDTLYEIVPIYSVIDFRIAEYKNRTFLTDILLAGGVEDALGNLPELESLFRIENENRKVRKSLKIKTVKDTVVYSFKKSEQVRVKYSKEKIPAEYQEAFAKFLLYKTEIHPSIAEEIIKMKYIPEYIRFFYTNIAVKTTTTYSLLESIEVGRIDPDFDNTNRVFAQRTTGTMDGIIDSMVNRTNFKSIESVDSNLYFDRASKLSKEGQHTSGVLCLFDYLLSTGIQPVNHIREIAAFLDSDTSLALFFSCLNRPQSKEEADLKIAQLNSLIKLEMEYGYIMNIFAANYVEPIDPGEAISYFYKALSQNPYITGAWLDLGKIYSNRYNYDDAWKCFGIMLNINADHPMAQELIDRKASLKKTFPKYFKTE